MTLHEYARTHETEDHRVLWVYDEDYRSEGSFALDTPEETERVVQEELRQLRNGDLVALGAIVQVRCPACSQWEEKDSLWGIVAESDTDKLSGLAEELLDLPWLKT